MKSFDDISIIDLLPENLSADETVHDTSEAIDPELRLAIDGRQAPLVYSAIDRLTSEQLDHIAEGFDLTNWRRSWEVSLKREMLKVMISQKRKMGTLSAIKRVLEPLGASIQVTEWWQKTPKGTPHTFTVKAFLPLLETDDLTIERQEDFFALLNEAKPARSHYDFILGQQAFATLYLAGAGRPVTYARSSMEIPPDQVNFYVTGVGRPVTFARSIQGIEPERGSLYVVASGRAVTYARSIMEVKPNATSLYVFGASRAMTFARSVMTEPADNASVFIAGASRAMTFARSASD